VDIVKYELALFFTRDT